MHKNFDAMKDSLVEQMSIVLERNNIAFDKPGLEKNLDYYGANKMALINLLRKHPHWNEEALAIVFNAGDIRRSSEADIKSFCSSLEVLAQEVFDSEDNQFSSDDAIKFKKALQYLCTAPQYVKNSGTLRAFKKNAGVSCMIGQRTSRVVHKLCKQYQIDEHPNYNAVFAVLADALNPLAIDQKAVLSVHPCDFITIADSDSWASASNSGTRGNMGISAADTLSIANDSISMIFYTVGDDTGAPYHMHPKDDCEVFNYKDGVLLQSRLYTDSNDNMVETVFRNIVHSVIADCMGQPNLWVLKKYPYPVKWFYDAGFVRNNSSAYLKLRSAATVSVIKAEHQSSVDSGYNRIVIGHDAYCVKCGEALTENVMLHCKPCTE